MADQCQDKTNAAVVPNILSIAGTDPSGGAGIQADIKSISALGGYAMSAVTALVAQNTIGVQSIFIPPSEFLLEQLTSVSSDIRIDGIKIGMLATTELINVVQQWLETQSPGNVVIDPVMISTSGDRLLDESSEEALFALLSVANMITPNIPELAHLLKVPIAVTFDEAVAQARILAQQVGCRVLVKGGHLKEPRCANALIVPVSDNQIQSNPGSLLPQQPSVIVDTERIATTNTHGTGCSLSAAITTAYARFGCWECAVISATEWLHESICAASNLSVGRGNGPVHHFEKLWQRNGIPSRPSGHPKHYY